MGLDAFRLKVVACLAVLNLTFLSVALPPVQARMIGTQEAMAASTSVHDARGRIQAFLDREDVQQLLRDQGVPLAEARARVAALTDVEAQRLVSRMDQLPAGGDAVGAIVGAAVLVFLVLLVTDILGFTRVFPFTRPAR